LAPIQALLCVAANVSILGVTYSLFTHAHQRYGLNDAFDRSVSILLDGPALKDEKNAVWVRADPQSGGGGAMECEAPLSMARNSGVSRAKSLLFRDIGQQQALGKRKGGTEAVFCCDTQLSKALKIF